MLTGCRAAAFHNCGRVSNSMTCVFVAYCGRVFLLAQREIEQLLI